MVRFSRRALVAAIFILIAVDADGSKELKGPMSPTKARASAEPVADPDTLIPDVPAQLDAPVPSPTGTGRAKAKSAKSDSLKPDTLPPTDTSAKPAAEPDTLTLESASAQLHAPTLPRAFPELDVEAIREIMVFRRAQGSPFRGTIFEDLETSGSDDGFLDALREAAVRRDEPAGDSGAGIATHSCEESYRQQIRRERACSTADVELVESLRLAGRHLDRKAADLEDARQYEDADRVRDLARSVRMQARSLAPQPGYVARESVPGGQAGILLQTGNSGG